MLAPVLVLAASMAIQSPDIPKTPEGKEPARSTEEVGDLSGFYVCNGQELGGKKYNGIAMLVKKNDIYLIQWMVSGGSTFSGIAIRQGNTLAASWTIANDRGVVRGVNLYRIDPGPRLTGRWSTLPGPGVMSNESLTFLRKLDDDE